MFDIGWSELLVIAIVAIIFVGPRELIPMLRTFGQFAGKMRRMASDFQAQFNEALREAELDQVTRSVEEVRNLSPVNALKRQFEEETKDILAPPGPREPAGPAASPPPELPASPPPAEPAAAPARAAGKRRKSAAVAGEPAPAPAKPRRRAKPGRTAAGKEPSQ